MYNRILVPLDGSRLAECALPHAEELVEDRDRAEILLVSATEQVQARTRAPEARELYHSAGPEVTVGFGKKQSEAQRYLGRIAKELETKGIKARTEVLPWPPAETIASYAERNSADIIVMSTHGRSGPSRWAYGSVADKVLRSSCAPVLLIRAPGCVPGV
jgi:nucleotide-binding universal stress UspA family protein